MIESREKAAKMGQHKYHGRPCKNCGGTLRYTRSGACVACVLRYSSKRKEVIKEMLERGGEHGHE